MFLKFSLSTNSSHWLQAWDYSLTQYSLIMTFGVAGNLTWNFFKGWEFSPVSRIFLYFCDLLWVPAINYLLKEQGRKLEWESVETTSSKIINYLLCVNLMRFSSIRAQPLGNSDFPKFWGCLQLGSKVNSCSPKIASHLWVKAGEECHRKRQIKRCRIQTKASFLSIFHVIKQLVLLSRSTFKARTCRNLEGNWKWKRLSGTGRAVALMAMLGWNIKIQFCCQEVLKVLKLLCDNQVDFFFQPYLCSGSRKSIYF